MSSGGIEVHGVVAPGWEPVRDAFAANFAERGEVGAALSVWRDGKRVVDVWGGVADPATGRAWTAETPVVCFSATKGLVAAVFLGLVAEGKLDLDAPIREVWPELGDRPDKRSVTARMVLNHRAGLSAVDAPLALTDVRDAPDRVHDALVTQVPLWEPGTDQGYAACSFGLYTAELCRRVAGVSVGTALAERITRPLGVDGEVALGRPSELRAAPAVVIPPSGRTRLTQQLPTALFRGTADGRLFRRVLLGTRTDAGRALLNPTLGPARFLALNDPDVHALELPWMNALVTARGLATVYAALAGDGALDGVRIAPADGLQAVRPRQSWSERDRVLQKPLGWSQGFLKDELHLFSPSAASFGHPGAGGCLGWCDPERGLAVGYVANAMDWRIRSPRALAVCHAVYAVAGG